MNGPDHYRAAERLLLDCQLLPSTANDPATYPATEDGVNSCANALAAAQVHATLALAASNLALGGMTDDGEWRRTLELNPVGQPTASREG